MLISEEKSFLKSKFNFGIDKIKLLFDRNAIFVNSMLFCASPFNLTLTSSLEKEKVVPLSSVTTSNSNFLISTDTSSFFIVAFLLTSDKMSGKT